MHDWQEIVRAHLASARLDPAREVEIVEELAQHLEDRYLALKARGVEDGEAERAALAELDEGDALVHALETSARRAHGDSGGPSLASRGVFRDLWSDLRYAARTLRRSPWFAATAVLCLGLGIAATSVAFGVVDALFFRAPTGVGEPGRIVRPYLTMRSRLVRISGGSAVLPYRLYEDIRGQSRSLEGLAGYAPLAVSVGLGLEARPADALRVTDDYFSVLRVQPALGRLFGAGESSPVAVVSFAYWRNELGAEPSVIGQPIMLNGHAFTIAGVAPEGFHGMELGAPSFWVPVSQSTELGGPSQPGLTSVARLAPGATAAQARAELEPLMLRALRSIYGASTEARLELGSIFAARGPYPSQQALVARWLAIAATLVLAIACANAANLLLSRTVARRREIAIRLSMGASRSRLVRQLLAESTLLAACGAAVGLLLARWGSHLVRIAGLPSLSLFSGGRGVAFAAAAMLLCVAACGLAPALAATRGTLDSALKSSPRGTGEGRSMTRSALMVMQVALGTLLLVGAGLFVHGLHNLLAIDPGIDFEHLATVSVDLRSAGYDDARAARFFDEAIGPLHRVPGVRHATVVSQPPLSDAFGTRFYVVPDSAWNDAVLASDPSEMLQRMQRGDIALAAAVGPQYFTTVGTPMLAGRDFGEQDVKGSTPVVIVNRTFAERDWPGESALGRCIDVVVDMRNMGDTQCYRVIGVAADAKYARLDEPQRAALFLPLSQDPIPNPRRNLLLRTAAAPVGVASAVRKSLAELDPDLPYVEVRPLAAELRPRLEAPRLGAALLSAFGALALVLAAIGLYGVVAYAVEQRRHEIGIRMALGAEARSVLSLVVREGMRLTLAGLAIGLAGSFGAARLIAHLLHGVGPADPLAFAGAAALFAAVGLLASVIPALRAARLDPAVTLRNE